MQRAARWRRSTKPFLPFVLRYFLSGLRTQSAHLEYDNFVACLALSYCVWLPYLLASAGGFYFIFAYIDVCDVVLFLNSK